MTFDAGAIEARLILNRTQFQADLAAARSEGDAFDGKTFEARAKLNYDEVKAAFAKIEQDWRTLQAKLQQNTAIDANNAPVLAKIAEIETAFETMRSSLGQHIEIRANTDSASQAAKSLVSGPITQDLVIDPGPAVAALGIIRTELDDLQRAMRNTLSLRLDLTQFRADVSEIHASIDRLQARLANSLIVRVNNSRALVDLAEVSASFNAMRRVLERTISLNIDTGGQDLGQIATAARALNQVGDAADRNSPRVRGFWASMLGLNSTFRLFGGFLPGFLGEIGGLHLVLDSLVEVFGTLVPAAIAFTAFGIAATPTVIDLSKQMYSLYTVTKAYDTTLGPITGHFQQVANAVKPEVYVLFGEALLLASRNTGVFAQTAQGAGRVLDELGARFVNAINNSKSLGTFSEKATSDLAGFGNVIGNIGGIIGGVLKVLPGYAEDLLAVAQSLTHIIESVVNSGFGQWLLQIGLAAHGALLWIGLLGTGFALLAGRALTVLPGMLLAVAVGLDRIGASGAATAIAEAGAAIEGLEISTAALGGIALLASAIGYLVYRMVTGKSAVQDFFDTLQQQATKANVLGLQATLTSQLAIAQDDYAKSTARVTDIQSRYNDIVSSSPTGLRQAGVALAVAKQQQSDYGDGLSQIKNEQQVVNQHVADAAKIFGNTANAWAALNDAGITSAQLLDKNKQHWEETKIEAQAFDAALRATTQSAGRYGSAQNALNFGAGDTANKLGSLDAAMTKVTQAEDNMFNVLINGEGTFSNFELTLKKNLDAAEKAAGGVTSSAKSAGNAIGGLGQANISLASAYYTQALPAAQKQIDALQMQAISTHDLGTVIGTVSHQLLGYAGNNVAARVAVVDLINNALGPGTVNLQTLNKWVGNNSTSLKGYQTIVDKTAVSASQLAGVLQGQVLQMIVQATVAAQGGQKAFNNFAVALFSGQQKGKSFSASGESVIRTLLSATHNADAAHRQFNTFAESVGKSKQEADQLWTSLSHQLLVDTARKAGESKGQFEAFAKQLGVTKGEADKLWTSLHKVAAGSPYNAQLNENGKGQFTISQLASAAIGVQGPPPGVKAPGAAAGLYIASGTTGTADDQIVRVSKGELIVPEHQVAGGAVDHLRGLIPGFKGGGSIGALAPATDAHWVKFQHTMTLAMERAMTAALKTAETKAKEIAAAAAAQNGVSGAGPVGGDSGVNAALARHMFPWGASEWPPYNTLEMHEAGYNRFAHNPSGAYGIPQALPPTKMPFAAQAGGGSHAGPQLSWMYEYIRSVYGTPSNAWAKYYQHPGGVGWYDQGGVLPPGVTMAFNGTGQNEHILTGNQMGNLINSLDTLSRSVNQLSNGHGGPGVLSAPGYTPGSYVGDYTGVVSPAGGGFGLTDANLGIAPSNSTSSGSGSGGGDTGTGGTGTGDGTGTGTPKPPKKPAGPNKSQKAAISLLEGHMGSYIWHNQVGYMDQDQALLHWLGVTKYDKQISEIHQIDAMLNTYKKKKDRKGIAAAEHLLTSFGVHVFTPNYTTKTNPSKKALIAKLESLMTGDISNNDMTDASQDNSLLTHLGVSKFTKELGQIKNLDALLAKFKKSKNASQVKAVETLLRQYGVKKYDEGGEWPNMTLGVNTSGRSEHVVTGSGMDELVDRLETLIKVQQKQLSAARAAPGAIASRVGPAITKAPMTGPGLDRRYPNNR